MTHSNPPSTKSPEENHIGTDNSQEVPESDAQTDGIHADGELNKILDQAQEWIKENQTMAMLGGFGLGVFIGVLLRR